MAIEVTSNMQEKLNQKITTGPYTSLEELLEAALAALEREEIQQE